MRSNRKPKRVLSILAAGVICMAGSMTAFAYEPLITVSNSENFVVEGDVTFVYKKPEVKKELLFSDFYFSDNNGQVYNLDNADNNREVCIHEYAISGVTTSHKKDGKGGCTVYEYDSLRCRFCGSIKLLDLISTVTYNPCPH